MDATTTEYYCTQQHQQTQAVSELSMGRPDQARTRPEPENDLKL